MTYRYTPPFGLRVLQIVVLLEALARGISMILTPSVVVATTDVAASAPLWVWGGIFCAFATVGLFGEALMSGTSVSGSKPNPRAWPSFIAHAGLMILYATLCLAYINAIVEGQTVVASAPAAMVVFGYTHWLFARRRKSHAT
ncbi:hypothetical protein SEA_POOMPHA_29 [Mycobacterium phage Poompha]|nr:hypothetical protein SEA_KITTENMITTENS_29 [Mycobacterium phage KittenMittens]QWS69313.1 membrane protein [Mycobacterium Phage PeaceMeal1]USL89163.1 hypothetical protein SEA_POOMPHA_29 [Mycobacterium phage Poompha]